MTLIDGIGHLSFLIIAFSLAMKDIIFLRILGISSGIVGIFYNYFVTSDPLWVPIVWLLVFILINTYMISSFYFANRDGGLTFEDIEIWKKNFLGLTINEYRTIKKISDIKTFGAGEYLITMGVKNEFLYFVNSGVLNIERDKKRINALSDGDVVGEMSFLTASMPNADVIANSETSCIIIDKKKLKSAMLKNPTLHSSMTNLFNINLTKKLAT